VSGTRVVDRALPFAGHFWTIAPYFAARARRLRSAAVPWSTTVEDPAVGSVALSGRLREGGSGERAVVLLHGLGGGPESAYQLAFERALGADGWTTLRLALRGADRSGADLHHAGFVDDLPAVLAAPPFDRARRIALVGISLGGHVALSYAAGSVDPRLAAVVAICSPVDLEAGATEIDRPSRWLYRRHLLQGVNEVYAAVAARRPVPVPVERVRRARTIREWDGLVVAPRFGFASAEDYYAKASVSRRLGDLAVPSLLVWSQGDPMVPWVTVVRALENLPGTARVAVTRRGGHVGFPADLDLGLGEARGLAPQVAGWLERSVDGGHLSD
jgi:predicted alpha/beta-fold hydrolase